MKLENLKMHQMEVIDMVEDKNIEYITEQEAKNLKELFAKHLKSYKEKDASVSDTEWLEKLFKSELPEIEEEVAKHDAEEILEAIDEFDDNLKSLNEAAQKGISKENWLVDKIQEASVGMAVNEYGQALQSLDDVLYLKNMELAEALQRSIDGHIKMSPNLDGNIAENMIAKTIPPVIACVREILERSIRAKQQPSVLRPDDDAGVKRIVVCI